MARKPKAPAEPVVNDPDASAVDVTGALLDGTMAGEMAKVQAAREAGTLPPVQWQGDDGAVKAEPPATLDDLVAAGEAKRLPSQAERIDRLERLVARIMPLVGLRPEHCGDDAL